MASGYDYWNLLKSVAHLPCCKEYSVERIKNAGYASNHPLKRYKYSNR